MKLLRGVSCANKLQVLWNWYSSEEKKQNNIRQDKLLFGGLSTVSWMAFHLLVLDCVLNVQNSIFANGKLIIDL